MIKGDKRIFAGFLLVSTLLGSVGQLLFKIGVDSGTAYAIAAYVLAGAAVYGAATLIYLYILGRAHLGWAYGFVGLSYTFTTLLAFFVLGEQVMPDRWIGVLIITFGTAMIGLS